MNLFQYKTLIAKIDKTNSYQQLRKIYNELSESPLNSFYLIHAINKTIKKFKSLTTSSIVKYKEYLGTTSIHFSIAVLSAESKEQILLLMSDWNNHVTIYLPPQANVLIKLSNNLSVSEFMNFSDSISIYPDRYSIAANRSINLLQYGRLPICILHYLKEVKDTEIYNYLLTESLTKANTWFDNGLQTNLIDVVDSYIIDYEKELESLKEANTIFKTLLKDNS